MGVQILVLKVLHMRNNSFVLIPLTFLLLKPQIDKTVFFLLIFPSVQTIFTHPANAILP